MRCARLKREKVRRENINTMAYMNAGWVAKRVGDGGENFSAARF